MRAVNNDKPTEVLADYSVGHRLAFLTSPTALRQGYHKKSPAERLKLLDASTTPTYIGSPCTLVQRPTPDRPADGVGEYRAQTE
jgi:hypothetical protein